MSAVTVTTTGVNASVKLADLGMFNIIHPTSIDVTTKGNTLTDIQNSEDLHTALTNNWVTATYNGTTINQSNVGQLGSFITSVIVQSNSNVFGTERKYAESLGVTTYHFPNSSTWINKINQNWTLPAGTYFVCWRYNWNADTVSYDFQSEFLINNASVEEHQQEPTDANGNWNSTGSDQKYTVSSFAIVTLSAGSHNFKIRFSMSTGETASIWGAKVSLWRVQ